METHEVIYRARILGQVCDWRAKLSIKAWCAAHPFTDWLVSYAEDEQSNDGEHFVRVFTCEDCMGGEEGDLAEMTEEEVDQDRVLFRLWLSDDASQSFYLDPTPAMLAQREAERLEEAGQLRLPLF